MLPTYISLYLPLFLSFLKKVSFDLKVVKYEIPLVSSSWIMITDYHEGSILYFKVKYYS